MGALTFKLTSAPPERLDLSPLVPARLAGLAVAEIEALDIGTTKTGCKVGDVFAVTGSNPEDIVFEGGSERFDNVGKSLRGGMVRVIGDVGAYLGRGMNRGDIVVQGSVCGPYAGTVMTGGRISIEEDVADATAASVPGAMHGMAGGFMIIGGSAGAYLGDRMRRGVIVVLGDTGEATANRMVGGTILAQSMGARAGMGMKRGTLITGAVTDLEPTFVSAGTYDAAFLALLSNWLASEAGEDAVSLVPARVQRFRGDMASLGKGEILVGGS